MKLKTKEIEVRKRIAYWDELRKRKGKYGLATMCIGGGQGIAVLIEAI